MNPIRLLLVDDHAVMRTALASLLGTCPELEVAGDAGDGETGVRLALKLRPDVVVMDLVMPETDGVTATRRLLERWPEARILVLTTVGDADTLAAALDAGALGAILKSADLDELRKAIASVAAREQYLSDEIAQIIGSASPAERLSPRQMEILADIVLGYTNADISRQLGISLQMVKEHMTKILKKLGAANRTEAVAIALKKHLLKM